MLRLVLASLLFPTLAIGAGTGDIWGTLEDGRTVLVYIDDPQRIIVGRTLPRGDFKEEAAFSVPGCALRYEVTENNREQQVLTCPRSGASPLAGTTYVGHPVKGSCERGDPYYRFTCTAGCGKASRAPKKLFQSYWEC